MKYDFALASRNDDRVTPVEFACLVAIAVAAGLW